MQIHGIPVNLKLNSTVLMIASFVISVLAGLILNLAGAGRGVYVILYSAGTAYLKLLFLLALPIVFLNLVSGVMQRLQLRSDGSSPARLWFFHSIAVVGAAVLGLAAGGIAGSAQIPAVFAGFSDFGLRWLRPVVPWALLLSVLTGAAAAKIGPEGEEARRLFRSLAEVFGYAGTLLLRLLPLGLFFLLCPVIGIRGLAVLWPGVKLVLVTAFCCAAYGTLVYGYQLRHCGKDCPAHFLRNFKPVLLQAFTACSSGSGEGEALHSLQRMGIAGEAGRTAWLRWHAGIRTSGRRFLCLDPAVLAGGDETPGQRAVLRAVSSFYAGAAAACCGSAADVRVAAGRLPFGAQFGCGGHGGVPGGQAWLDEIKRAFADRVYLFAEALFVLLRIRFFPAGPRSAGTGNPFWRSRNAR